MNDEQSQTENPMQRPHLLGCIFGLVWMALIPVTALFFIGAYGAVSRGYGSGEPHLVEFGWWLLAGGIACTAILCCTIILNIRIRKLMREELKEQLAAQRAKEQEVEG